MRLLIDSAISPLVAKSLAAEHDVVHVREIGLGEATDVEIIEAAVQQDRVVVSCDTDFGTILALRRQTKPSFVLLRGDIERRPEEQALILVRELPALEDVLSAGAVVVITRERIRVRTLPVDRS